MPLVAVVLIRALDLPPVTRVILVALALSPVPAMMPKKVAKAGVDISYGVGLMAILAIVSIVVVPAALDILERYFVGRELGIPPGMIASLVLKAVLIPLAAGMAVRAVLPAVAKRIEKPLMTGSTVLLLLAVVGLLYGAIPAIREAMGGGTVAAMVLFIVVGSWIGKFLGGPGRDDSVALSIATVARHPGIAVAIASAIVGALQTKWRRRKTTADPDALAA
jgi:BASS family bile acid:Na+ symporter